MPMPAMAIMTAVITMVVSSVVIMVVSSPVTRVTMVTVVVSSVWIESKWIYIQSGIGVVIRILVITAIVVSVVIIPIAVIGRSNHTATTDEE